MESVAAKIREINGRVATVVVTAAPMCPRCAAGRGCGAGIFHSGTNYPSMRIALPPSLRVEVDDEIRLAIDPRKLLLGAGLAYGIPLVAMVVALFVAQWVFGGMGDMGGIVVASGGLLTGMAVSRIYLARKPACKELIPVVQGFGDGRGE